MGGDSAIIENFIANKRYETYEKSQDVLLALFGARRNPDNKNNIIFSKVNADVKQNMAAFIRSGGSSFGGVDAENATFADFFDKFISKSRIDTNSLSEPERAICFAKVNSIFDECVEYCQKLLTHSKEPHMSDLVYNIADVMGYEKDPNLEKGGDEVGNVMYQLRSASEDDKCFIDRQKYVDNDVGSYCLYSGRDTLLTLATMGVDSETLERGEGEKILKDIITTDGFNPFLRNLGTGDSVDGIAHMILDEKMIETMEDLAEQINENLPEGRSRVSSANRKAYNLIQYDPNHSGIIPISRLKMTYDELKISYAKCVGVPVSYLDSSDCDCEFHFPSQEEMTKQVLFSEFLKNKLNKLGTDYFEYKHSLGSKSQSDVYKYSLKCASISDRIGKLEGEDGAIALSMAMSSFVSQLDGAVRSKEICEEQAIAFVSTALNRVDGRVEHKCLIPVLRKIVDSKTNYIGSPNQSVPILHNLISNGAFYLANDMIEYAESVGKPINLSQKDKYGLNAMHRVVVGSAASSVANRPDSATHASDVEMIEMIKRINKSNPYILNSKTDFGDRNLLQLSDLMNREDVSQFLIDDRGFVRKDKVEAPIKSAPKILKSEASGNDAKPAVKKKGIRFAEKISARVGAPISDPNTCIASNVFPAEDARYVKGEILTTNIDIVCIDNSTSEPELARNKNPVLPPISDSLSTLSDSSTGLPPASAVNAYNASDVSNLSANNAAYKSSKDEYLDQSRIRFYAESKVPHSYKPLEKIAERNADASAEKNMEKTKDKSKSFFAALNATMPEKHSSINFSNTAPSQSFSSRVIPPSVKLPKMSPPIILPKVGYDGNSTAVSKSDRPQYKYEDFKSDFRSQNELNKESAASLKLPSINLQLNQNNYYEPIKRGEFVNRNVYDPVNNVKKIDTHSLLNLRLDASAKPNDDSRHNFNSEASSYSHNRPHFNYLNDSQLDIKRATKAHLKPNVNATTQDRGENSFSIMEKRRSEGLTFRGRKL